MPSTANSNLLKRLEICLRTGQLADVDLHFARAVAGWNGAENNGVSVVLAAALVSHLAGQGHVCADLPHVAGAALPFAADWEAPMLADWLPALRASPVVGAPGAATPLILDGERLYLGRYWQHEQAVAQMLRARAAHVFAVDEARLSEAVQRLLPGDALALAGQRHAVATAARSGISLISGGPGTGKTTTLAALLALIVELVTPAQAGVHDSTPLDGRSSKLHPAGLFSRLRGNDALSSGLMAVRAEPVEASVPFDRLRANGINQSMCSDTPPRILLAAPTGKAAARMQDAVREVKVRLALPDAVAAAIPETARTLHRLLGMRPDGSARHDAAHPLACDLLVIDEASMVDLSLMSKTLAALPASARLVLLGDRDQLASVEAGAVFADLCLSAASGGVLRNGYAQLSHSFRFGGEAGIGQLAKALRAGDSATAVALLVAGGDGLAWQAAADPEALLRGARQGYRAYLDAVAARAAPEELHRLFAGFRVLSAYREGPTGIRRLNAGLEQAIGVPRRQRWYAGRPVMIAANDYGLGLFNGDIGIAAADAGSGELKVWFTGEQGLRGFAPTRLPAHETAWAMTVHKSQGSEFDAVLVALPTDAENASLLTRELLYTAVTRARQRVELWGSAAVIESACQRKVTRQSGLAERLTEAPG